MGDIIVRYIDLPVTVRACTVIDESDDFNVYINSALSTLERQLAYAHELEHINRDHFYDCGVTDISTIETEAAPDRERIGYYYGKEIQV